MNRLRRTKKEVMRDERSLFDLTLLRHWIDKIRDTWTVQIRFTYETDFVVVKQKSVAFFLPMLAEYHMLKAFYYRHIIRDSHLVSLDFVLCSDLFDYFLISHKLCVLRQ